MVTAARTLDELAKELLRRTHESRTTVGHDTFLERLLAAARIA
jgi:hypothetical protein